ncbi:MAG TPA: sialate O-acetylesterase, partial [Trueperaceae bacterium]|nr:sialate O-acetylesterase [Trueperaceae bacterium]
MKRAPQWLSVTALALVALLAACEDPLVPPVAVDAYQLLRSTGPVAAVQITISYQPNFDFVGISGTPAGALVHTYDNGAGSLTIGLLLNGAAATGQLVRLNWNSDGDGPDPAFAAVAGYDAELAQVSSRLELGPLTPLVGATNAPSLSLLEDDDSAVGSFAAARAITTASVSDELPATFADYPLGDLDKSGIVDVRDAFKALAIVADDVATEAYDRYHADLTGDYTVTMSDVTAALKKAVDPTVPAHMVVKPGRLTYLELVAGRPVLVGNGGSVAFSELTFLEENPRGGNFVGDETFPVAGQSAVYTFTSQPNDVFGQLIVATGEQSATVTVGNIVILLAGQSNASGLGAPAIPSLQNGASWPEVRALTNDYRWLPAVEPLDSPYNQELFDPVSLDPNAAVSPGVQAGRLLNRGSPTAGVDGTDRFVYLIPAALGGSGLASGWYLGPSDLAGTDRLTLFGSAAYRGLVSAGLRDMPAAAVPSEHEAEGGPVNAVFWYQGETDSRDSGRRSNYVSHTGAVL